MVKLGQLPENFDSLSQEEQNYKLAMKVLEKRRVLNLPKELVIKIIDRRQEAPRGIKENDVITPTSRGTTRGPKWEEYEDTITGITPGKSGPGMPIREPGPVIKTGPEVGPTEPKKEKLFLIDISEIAKRMAWTQAEERWRKETQGKGWIKRAWKGLTEQGAKLKYYDENLKSIQADNNLMRAINERVTGQKMPGNAPIISREYLELLDKTVEVYEKNIVQSQREIGDAINDDPNVKEQVAKMLRLFQFKKWDELGAAYKGLDERQAVELFVKTNIVKLLKDEGKSFTGDVDRYKEAKGLLYASNFYEFAKTFRDKNKEGIEKMVGEYGEANREAIEKHFQGMFNLDLQLGLAERDLMDNRPKNTLKWYEKMVNFGEKHAVLGKVVMNPFMVGVAGTVLAGGARQVAMRTAKWAAIGGAAALGVGGFWVPLGVGAAVGGVYRAYKRGKDVKYDIAQDSRHETLGGQGGGILDGQNKDGDLRYDKMLFKDALAKLDNLKGVTNFSDDQKKQVAEIYARLGLEKDLLVDKDRKYSLDMFRLTEDEGKSYGTVSVAKANLRIKLAELGLDEKDIAGLIVAEKGKLLDDIKETEERQAKFRRMEMLKSGIGGAVLGFAGGWVAKHGLDLIRDNWPSNGDFSAVAGTGIKGPGVPGTGVSNWEEWKSKLGVSKISHHDWHHDHYAENGGGHVFSGKELQGHFLAGGGKVTFDYHGALENIKNNLESKLPALGQNFDGGVDSRFEHLMPKDVHGKYEAFTKALDAFKTSHPEVNMAEYNPDTAPGDIKSAVEKLDELRESYNNTVKGFLGKMHERLQVRIIPTEAMNKAGEGIVVGHLDASGKIPMDGKFAQFFDSKGQLLAKYLEVGSVNEKGQFDTLATAVGKGFEMPVADNVPGGPPIMPIENTEKPDSWTVPIVPPQRKFFERKEEKKAREEKEKKKQKEAARKEHDESNGENNEQGEHTHENELKEKHKLLFDKARVEENRQILELDFPQEVKQEIKAAGLDIKVVAAWWKEEDRAKAEAAKKKAEAHHKKSASGKDAGHDSGEDHKEETIYPVHKEGPSIEAYIDQAGRLEEVAVVVRKYYERVEYLDKRLKEFQSGKGKLDSEDLDDLHEEFKKKTETDWSKDFNPKEFRKQKREKLRSYLKTPVKQAPAKNTAKPKPGQAGESSDPDSSGESDETVVKENNSEGKESQPGAQAKEFHETYKNINVDFGPINKSKQEYNHEDFYKNLNAVMRIIKKENPKAAVFKEKFTVFVVKSRYRARKLDNGYELPYDMKPADMAKFMAGKFRTSKDAGGKQNSKKALAAA